MAKLPEQNPTVIHIKPHSLTHCEFLLYRNLGLKVYILAMSANKCLLSEWMKTIRPRECVLWIWTMWLFFRIKSPQLNFLWISQLSLSTYEPLKGWNHTIYPVICRSKYANTDAFCKELTNFQSLWKTVWRNL